MITSFYGQTQFQARFGEPNGQGGYAISAAWQSGLSNSSVVGQLVGLTLSGWLCDRIGPRRTTMCFLTWMCAAVFATFFAPSLPVLAFGMFVCGVGWGSFQTMTTAVGFCGDCACCGNCTDQVVRLRGCSNSIATLCYRLGLYVLGYGHPHFLCCCSSRRQCPG